MEPHLIATLKAEETLFELLRQIQTHLMFLVSVLQKLGYFFMNCFNHSGLLDVSSIRFCGILRIKLDVCFATSLSQRHQ